MMISTQERIMQAALKLFAQKGFEATSIRDIAQEADVNSSTLYYYMSNKEEFLLSIMKNGLEQGVRASEKIFSSMKLPEERLAALISMHVMIHGLNQLITIVTDTEFRALHGNNKELIRSLRRKYESFWREAVREGVEEGVFTGVKNPKLAAFALLEMCTGVAHWYSSEGQLTLEQIRDEFVNMALNLLGAKREGRNITVHDLNLPHPSNYELNVASLYKGSREFA